VLTARAVDQAGNKGKLSAPVTVLVVGQVGMIGACASTDASPLALAALGAVMVLMRRRRPARAA